MEDLAKLYPVKSSLPCPSSHYMVNTLCWEQEILNHPVLAAAYLDCSDDAARFRFAENFLAKELKLEVQPRIVFRGKDIMRAEAARQSGNRLFAAGDLPGALAAYSECIINAPFKDKGCIVLALGNRSAVFFRLERYAECIRDIDQAVLSGYPLDSVKKLLLRKAEALLALGCPLNAIEVLEKDGNQLNVCSGSVNEICQLAGDMQDYSKLLASAVRKHEKKEKETTVGTSVAGGCCDPKPDHTPKCPNRLDQVEEFDMLKLRGGSGRKFLSLSASVSFRFRGLENPSSTFAANQDIEAGDVLLKERAFVGAVHKPALLTNCNVCLRWTDAPFPCPQCSVVVFCSPMCASPQEAALHARECSFWQTISLGEVNQQAILPHGVKQLHRVCEMAFRMMLTKSPKEWLSIFKKQRKTTSESMLSKVGKEKYEEKDVMDVLKLAKFARESKKTGLFRGEVAPAAALTAVYLVKVLEKEYFSRTTLRKKVRDYLGSIVIQALTVCDRDFQAVLELLGPSFESRVSSALVLHPIYSQLAHSCDPNLIGVHYGDVLVVRARRPIKKKEALTTPYPTLSAGPIFARLPREERHRTLRLIGYDGCTCLACRQDWPSSDELRAQHREGSYKVKCPRCALILATFKTVQECPVSFAGRCPSPSCKSGLGLLGGIVLCMSSDSTGSLFDGDSADDLFKKAQLWRSLFVAPAHNLVGADINLERALWRCGNKRFDDVLPYPDEEIAWVN